jgi:hypothetical protein
VTVDRLRAAVIRVGLLDDEATVFQFAHDL